MKPSDGYIAYIVNPKSGSSSGKRACWQFQRYLASRGYKTRVLLTRSLLHACELAAEAVADPDCMLVVSAGGDGTQREVIRGLEGSDKPLLVIPGGTENLLANELGFDRRVQSLIAAFEGGQRRDLDLGVANGKRFASIVGCGFDGAMVEMVSQRRTGHINYFDYIYPLWRTFWNHRFEPMKVEVDGTEVFDGPGLVFVGNISRYAIGLQILHYADFSDGLLDVCIYKCGGRTHLAKHSIFTVLKQHAKSRDVIYQQGKEIKITSAVESIKTEIDGDPGPALPLRISVIPRAIKCVVPPGARPAGIRARIIRALR